MIVGGSRPAVVIQIESQIEWLWAIKQASRRTEALCWLFALEFQALPAGGAATLPAWTAKEGPSSGWGIR